jgi:predicted GTPase
VGTPASQISEAVLIEFPGSNLNAIRKVAGTISEAAGKCLIISSPEKIAASSPIRVQGKDLLFLGDVVKSTPGEEGRWSVHMNVKSKFMIF